MELVGEQSMRCESTDAVVTQGPRNADMGGSGNNEWGARGGAVLVILRAVVTRRLGARGRGGGTHREGLRSSGQIRIPTDRSWTYFLRSFPYFDREDKSRANIIYLIMEIDGQRDVCHSNVR